MNSQHVLGWDSFWTDPRINELFGESLAALQKYLSLTKNTESPKVYHLWSLLSLTAALASSTAYLDNGVSGRLKLNLGVVLTGRPAIRKTSAINFMTRFAADFPLHYGPTDTSGARHGIMSAMQTRWQDDLQDEVEIPLDIDALASADFSGVLAKMNRPRVRPSHIYFTAPELGRLLTAQTRELLDFFADGMDGEAIYYQTKTGTIRIPEPLINLIGGTTPDSLASMLPRDSHTHGLLSRLIFVYASKPEKPVPIPPVMNAQELNTQAVLRDLLRPLYEEKIGALRFDAEAHKQYERLYTYSIKTMDFKLNAYAGRRGQHLARLSALLAILRGDKPYTIRRHDVGLAHCLLVLTEDAMDGAYAGLERSLEARMYMIIREMIESEGEPISETAIEVVLARSGFRNADYTAALLNMTSSKKLKKEGGRIHLATPDGAPHLSTWLELYAKRSTQEPPP